MRPAIGAGSAAHVERHQPQRLVDLRVPAAIVIGCGRAATFVTGATFAGRALARLEQAS